MQRAGGLALVRAALVAITVVALPAHVRAQSVGPSAPPRGTLNPRDSARSAARESVVPLPDAIRKEAIVATGAPRSYQVVAVPLPEEISSQSPVAYEVYGTGAVTIIGRRGGTLEPSASQRRVLITMGIPSHARAGRTLAARVTFVLSDDVRYEVPVEIEVAPVRRVAIKAPEEIRGVLSGDRLDLRYRVLNSGNLTDTINVDIIGPENWHARALTTGPMIVEAGAEAERVVRLAIPENAGTGDFFVRLSATTPDRKASSAATVLVNVGDRKTGGVPVGPTLRAALTSAAAGTDETASVLSVDVNGPVSATVQVDGRVTMQAGNGPALNRGLTRVGTFITSPYVSLWSPSWRISGGNASAAFSELTGVNAWGNGLSGTWTRNGHNVSGMIARTQQASPLETTHPILYGGNYSFPVSFARLGVSGSHVADASRDERELDALGVSAISDEFRYGTLRGELAYRDFTGGSGVGWLGEFTGGDGPNRAMLKWAHAPGGSQAFAHARDEFSAAMSRAIGPRYDVAASVLATNDSTSGFSSITSCVASVVQQYRLSDISMLRLEGRASSFDATTLDPSIPSFGNAEYRLGLGYGGRIGAYTVSGELGGESITRSLENVPSELADQTGLRLTWRARAERLTPRGLFQAENTIERGASNADFIGNATSFTLRASQIRFDLLPRDVFLNGEISHQTWGTARNSATILHMGASMPLPHALELSLSVERNPLYTVGTGTSSWVFALKVERGTSLPRLRLASSFGFVFQDLNGNGVRDASESGVPNVLVRQGDARATTDKDGRYQFWQKTHGTPTVEISSLPYGWMLGALPTKADVRSSSIALVPTSTIEIDLVLSAEPGGRVPEVDLSRTVVYARDAHGKEWQARRSSSTAAVFDALPLGEYVVEFDFTDLSEPLRTASEKLTFAVTGHGTQHINVPLFGRPLRFFRPAQQATKTDATANPSTGDRSQ